MSAERHSRRASPALQKLAEDDPAFAALSLWCRHRDADIEGFAQSTAHEIRYGSAFAQLSLPEQVGLAAHHILHVALRHATRGAGLRTRLGEEFESALFNLGADALINDTLSEIGLIQPRPHVSLRTLKLPDDSLQSWDVERLYFALVGVTREGRGRDDKMERAAEDGFYEDIQLAAAGAEEDGAQGPTEGEWRQHLERALEAGRLAGRGLGVLGHRLADIPETRTPWEVLLRRLAARALREEAHVSFRRPAGRWVAMESEARRAQRPVPVFEPSQQRMLHQPRIVVALDSSGSVSPAQLSLFGAQIGAIAGRGGAEVHLLIFDEEVRSAQTLASRDVARTLGTLELSRDGGTDFRPAIAQAISLQPSLLVMLSDLEGPLPEAPPKFQVIWGLPAAPRTLPPFGRVITLDA
ncbi:MAG: VWA-like domain-containing protein [Dinoroseobacter sp.]|nr:VWA-like domain-containing protein [Dinoroseobacter sp.]